VLAVLVEPSGQPLDIQSTRTGQTSSGARAFGRTIQFFEKTPGAGRWALTVWVNQGLDSINPDSFSQPFSGRIGFQSLPVVANGLPNSALTVLPQGSPATATIRLTNAGNSVKDFFVDSRLADKDFISVLSYGNTGVHLPLSLNAQPSFFVPPNSDLLFVAAQGTVPIVMDMLPSSNGPDYLGSQVPGNSNIDMASATELAPNLWFALPAAQGPIPLEGIDTATVDVSAAVSTNPFDTAVSSSTGNAWMQLAIDNSAPYTPLTLNPGASGTITVTITPNAPSGTVVSGFIELETFSSSTSSGDEIAVLPYTYTVG
jgi:hypothetical protein